MKLTHNTGEVMRTLQNTADGMIEIFAAATCKQAPRIIRALQQWNLQYYDTGDMYDGWYYECEPDGVLFINFMRYAGFNGRAEEARDVTESEIDVNEIAREVAKWQK